MLGSVHRDQVDDEDERLVGTDDAAGTAFAICQHRRDRDPASSADVHAGHALVPAGDDLPLAELELERVAAVPGRVELLPGSPRDAHVVNLDDATVDSLLAATDDEVFELELVG